MAELRYCDYYGQMSYADFLAYCQTEATGNYEISVRND